MKKTILTVLGVAALLLSIQLGLKSYQKHVPPFKEGTCLDVEYSKIFKTKTSEPTTVFVSIQKNHVGNGVSEAVVVYYQIGMGLYFGSKEFLTFYDLRNSGAREVSCNITGSL